MTGGVDQVDKESSTVGLLLDPLHIDLRQLVVKLELNLKSSSTGRKGHLR